LQKHEEAGVHTESIAQREVKAALFGKYGEHSGDSGAFLIPPNFEKTGDEASISAEFDFNNLLRIIVSGHCE
jgi:hypothetical protein